MAGKLSCPTDGLCVVERLHAASWATDHFDPERSIGPHFSAGSTTFSCGRPPSSMSKSGSNTVCPCAPRSVRLRLQPFTHLLLLGVGDQAALQIADYVRGLLLRDVVLLAGISGEVEEFGLARQ